MEGGPTDLPNVTTLEYEIPAEMGITVVQEWQPVDRAPDFYQFTVNLGAIVGWSGTLTVDSKHHVYVAPIGLNVGKSATPISFSAAAGWMRGWGAPGPPKSVLRGFLSSWGCSLGGAFGGGGFFDFNSFGQAWSLAVGSPQIGLSCSYGLTRK
jgi:hypothetical protein